MKLYEAVGSHVDGPQAAALCARLAQWHDAMVTHERSLRVQGRSEQCDDDCPHVEASTLWMEAVMLFGARAYELDFLRSRAARSWTH